MRFSFKEITTLPQTWAWLQGPMLDTLFPSHAFYSGGTPNYSDVASHLVLGQLALVGAVCSIPQMFILPPLMAIYAVASVGYEGVSRGAPPALGGRYGQRALLGAGCILFVLCTYASLKHCVGVVDDDDDAS